MTAQESKAYSRAWYLANRERLLKMRHERYQKNKTQILAQTAAYQKAHPEIARKSCRKYQAANRDKCRQANRKWRASNLVDQRARERAKAKKAFADNPEAILASNRKWANANKDNLRARSARRRAVKRGATLGDTRLILEWMKQIRSLPTLRCHWCGTKVIGSEVHFDHVIALGAGGSHSIGNLCASCPQCNLSKQDKLPGAWDRNRQIFLSL